MQSRVRSRFARTVIESVNSGADAAGIGALRARLPARLATLVETDIFGSRDPNACVSLDDAEALFFEVDSILGEGSGRTLEEAGRSLAARTLTQGGVVASSDPELAARLLHGQLAQVFEQVNLLFELRSTNDGFVLTLGIGGRPRSARALRHLTVGYLKAAATGAGPLGASLRIDSQVSGDRAQVTVKYGAPEAPAERVTPVAGPNSRRRPSVMLRAPNGGTLAAEVDRILGATSAPPSRGSGSFTAVDQGSDETAAEGPTPTDTVGRGSR